METTLAQIKDSDAAVLIYDVTKEESKRRVVGYWLPEIARAKGTLPVLIVGNKLDLVHPRADRYDRDDQQKDFIDKLVRIYPQIEMGIECSAKEYKNLSDLVYCAQRAVIYPIYPLYDHTTKVVVDGAK